MVRATANDPKLSDSGGRRGMGGKVAPEAGAVTPGAVRRRQRGRVHIDQGGDFGDEPTLLVETFVTWREADGPAC